jgi:hypothetical protein
MAEERRMIYLEETLNLVPASPEKLDSFVEFAREGFVPVCKRLGCGLVIAWYNSQEWFCQVKHVLEFDDLDSLKGFRRRASQDAGWGEYAAYLEEVAPVRRTRLLEPLAPIWPGILRKAAEESQQSPAGAYFAAVLEVAPNQWTDFVAGLSQPPANFPIVCSWRPVSGSPNEVIDLWKGSLPLSGYQPANEGMIEFFRNLRVRAPKERVEPVFTLPYSDLR